MLNRQVNEQKGSMLLAIFLVATFFSPIFASADPLRLAKSPLADSTTSEVLPNLMFIIDNSGSMRQDYTPDYISSEFGAPSDNARNCKDSGDNDGNNTVFTGVGTGTGTGANRYLDMCVVGDVPFMSPDLNSQYYNPEISYTPGVNADGTSLPSQNAANTANFASVATDPYAKQRSNMLKDGQTTTNLNTAFPDRLWCSVQNPTPAQRLDTAVCRRNTDYLYPDATFRFGRLSTDSNPNQNNTAAMLDSVVFRAGSPYYYRVIPTEYCNSINLTNCVSSSVPTGAFTFPARSRWCSDVALTNCQGINTSTFKFPRYVGSAGITGVAAVGSLQITNAGTGTSSLTSLTVNGVQILAGTGAGCGTAISNSSSGTGSTRRQLLANAIVARINSCVSNPEYTAVSDNGSNPIITITSTIAAGATGNGTIVRANANSTINVTANALGGVTAVSGRVPYTFARVDIVNTTATYPKSIARTDCAGAVGPTGCSFQEEMTNFSNWYAYYRTRMQGMKTAASRAFRNIDSDYRVGFVTINGLQYLPLAKFDSGAGQQKSIWYTRLFAADPNTGGGTPLRSGLANVGRMFAGKQFSVAGSTSGSTVDPVQYSCQQNFALLTTDGYWNSDTTSTIRNVDGSGAVGNADGGSTPRPMLDNAGAQNTLSDVAKYYYDTDLRDNALNNCNGSLGLDVCEDNVFVSGTDNNNKQHMTTFTLGLGVDGTLLYQPDYKTASSGDFADIKSGTRNWPAPAENQETTIDDLWHAAVNGQGQYFSAKDPAQLVKGLSDALSAIDASTGAGAAAATSALNPIAGDNFAYVASYTTVRWTGNLEARTIDTETGVVSQTAAWCAEDIVEQKCETGEIKVSGTGSGGDTKHFCVASTSGLNFSACDEGNAGCTQIAPACSGTMAARVSNNSDNRTIYMNDDGTLQPFTYSNLSSAQQTFFSAAYLSAGRLSQWTSLTPTQQAVAQGANLVNYLRGQKGFEERTSNAPNNVFRLREAILGDIVNSKPEYVGQASQAYLDPGYEAFKTSTASRRRMVYIGANDGMLHAFDATTGQERWAFVPTEVIKNMWKLADSNYTNKHDYFVNNAPVAADICIAACDNSASASWKTVLVGGLGAGGRSFYAIDITNPDAPELLWEFDNTLTGAGDPNMGYSFAEPRFTKLEDGTWVVLLTSGYNNMPEPAVGSGPNDTPVGDTPYNTGNGLGYLYVVDPLTGDTIKAISTGEGSTTSPSGFAKISTFSQNPFANQTALYVYGGDLEGDLWRFDINDDSVFKLAELKNGSGASQPITVSPELSVVANKRIVFVGTGQYLQIEDLTDTSQQTLYAITDIDGATLADPRGELIEQVITTEGNARKSTANDVDYSVDRGWYIDLPDNGERQNVASQLVFGTLLVPTTVPSNSVCSPGGYGWFNFFDFKTGAPVNPASNVVSQRTNSPVVGFNVVIIDGKPVVTFTQANNPTPTKLEGVEFAESTTGFKAKRAIWREISPPTE